MSEKMSKEVRRQLFGECAQMMAFPTLMNTLILTGTTLLGALTADTLGAFTDAAFSLDLSLGLKKVLLLAGYILGVALLMPAVQLVSEYVMLIYALRHDNIVFGHYLDKDPEKAMALDLGEVQYQLEDAPCMMRIHWVNNISRVISIPISLSFLLYWAGKVSWGLTVLMVLLGTLNLITPLLFKKKLAEYDRREKDYLAKRRSCEADAAALPHLIALWRTGDAHLGRMAALFGKYWKETAVRQIRCKIFSSKAGEFVGQIVHILLLFAGAVMISKGSITPGGLAAMLIYLGVVQTVLKDFGLVIEELPLLMNAAERTGTFYTDAEPDEGEMLRHFDGLSGKNISFSYGDRPVFSELDFSVQPGEIVALQGENGHGKSTLVKLICGLLKSYQGEIQVNRRDLRAANLKSWRQLIAYAPQNPMLFHVTVRENVMLSNPDAPAELVSRYMEDFGIAALAERTLSEDSELSGGERQKISIIRAMLKKSELLILDEPSNHLDINSIEALKRHIRDMDKTVIFISHDPLLTEAADRVMQI